MLGSYAHDPADQLPADLVHRLVVAQSRVNVVEVGHALDVVLFLQLGDVHVQVLVPPHGRQGVVAHVPFDLVGHIGVHQFQKARELVDCVHCCSTSICR